MCFVNLLDIHTSTKHIRMSLTLNGSSAVQHFKCGDAIKICDRLIFDFFYVGLSHLLLTIIIIDLTFK